MIGIDDDESEPLYESQTFEYEFKRSGTFTIACINYRKAKCKVLVAGLPTVTEVIAPKPQPLPKAPPIPALEDRPFVITPMEIHTVVVGCEVTPSQ